MNLFKKNIVILIILFFLVSYEVINISWKVGKSLSYVLVFLFVTKKLSPELYEYLNQLFKLDKIKVTSTNIVMVHNL